MSRVGKNPVTIPQGVEVQFAGRTLSVKGKLGQMNMDVPGEVDVAVEGNEVSFKPRGSAKRTIALWGTTRANTAKMVKGVSEGFSRKLQVVGVGYRAAVQGSSLDLSAGYSHPVKMAIPQGIKVEVKDNVEITITGHDDQQVGQFAANVRAVRKPEPYKGKGIRYVGEYIRMKEGKKK